MSIIRWELSDVIVFAAMLHTTKARQSFKQENSLHQHCVPGNLLHKQIPIRRDNERGKGNGQMCHGIQDIVLHVLCYGITYSFHHFIYSLLIMSVEEREREHRKNLYEQEYKSCCQQFFFIFSC
jgi:hypothetical protein